MPSMVATPGGQTNWHVPADDGSHWKYTFIFDTEQPLDRERVLRTRAEMTPDYRPLQNKANRYQQDRAAMRNLTYAGMGRNFQVHDLFATEGQGPFQDRTAERLAPSDVAINQRPQDAVPGYSGGPTGRRSRRHRARPERQSAGGSGHDFRVHSSRPKLARPLPRPD